MGKDICAPVFVASLFTIAKTWKQPTCPLRDEWIKKMLYIHTVESYSAIKHEILPFATTWMNPEGVMLSEMSQMEKDIYPMLHSYVEDKQTHRYQKEKGGRRRKGVRGRCV